MNLDNMKREDEINLLRNLEEGAAMTMEDELNAIDGEIVQSVMMLEGILDSLQKQPERKVTQAEVKVFMAHITQIAMGVHLQVGIIRKHMGLGIQKHGRPKTE